MTTLPLNCSDDDIRNLVVTWSELLALEKYEEACAMFPTTFGTIPDDLREVPVEYCGEDDATITSIHALPDPEEFIRNSITVNYARGSAEEQRRQMLAGAEEAANSSDSFEGADMMRSALKILLAKAAAAPIDDLELQSPEAKEIGSDLGYVDYRNVPLNGEPSDLTAQFRIVKSGAAELTLRYVDMHVM